MKLEKKRAKRRINSRAAAAKPMPGAILSSKLDPPLNVPIKSRDEGNDASMNEWTQQQTNPGNYVLLLCFPPQVRFLPPVSSLSSRGGEFSDSAPGDRLPLKESDHPGVHSFLRGVLISHAFGPEEGEKLHFGLICAAPRSTNITTYAKSAFAMEVSR